jgi:tripartite-type tricarboxylate transporter receptor subunit TctC
VRGRPVRFAPKRTLRDGCCIGTNPLYDRGNGMKLHRRHFLHFTSSATVLSLISRIARAQTYPTRPIHFVVPFPAGPNDALARLAGQRMSEDLKQPVVVDTRPGATGTIGADVVVRAAPGGYTLLFTVDLPITMAPALMKLNYDVQKDLIPIAAVVKSDNVLVVNPATGIRSMAELVAAAKAKPGTLTFSSAGHASPAHMCGEMIKRQAAIDMVHVPYTSAAAAMNAALAGNVSMFCGPIGVALPHIKAGTVYALGVTGSESSPLLPEVTPLAASYPGLVISAWYGLFAPSGTPDSVTNILRDEFKKIFTEPELQPTLLALGLTREWVSGSDLVQKIASDTAKWRDFIAAANIHAE